MSDQPDIPIISDTGESEPGGERRDVLDPMAGPQRRRAGRSCQRQRRGGRRSAPP